MPTLFQELLQRRSGDQLNCAALVLGEARYRIAVNPMSFPLEVIDKLMDELEAVGKGMA